MRAHVRVKRTRTCNNNARSSHFFVPRWQQTTYLKWVRELVLFGPIPPQTTMCGPTIILRECFASSRVDDLALFALTLTHGAR